MDTVSASWCGRGGLYRLIVVIVCATVVEMLYYFYCWTGGWYLGIYYIIAVGESKQLKALRFMSSCGKEARKATELSD